MLKLGERIFMNITKNINKIINILFVICLISILMVVSTDSLVLLLSIPIVLVAIKLNYGFVELISILVASIIVGYLFMDIETLGFEVIPILLLTLILAIISKSNLSDKNQIALNFLLTSIIFIGLYKYQMVYRGLDLSKMADELKEVFEQNTEYAIPDKTYELSVSLYPAILSSLSLIYAFISLKLVRNFMAYKNKGSDMIALNMLRISKKDFIILVIISIGIYLVVPALFAINQEFVMANIIWILNSILLLNGMSVYDYLISRRRSNLSRGMQWFFVIILFYFFAILFMIIGIFDIFLDFRARRERSL